MADDDVKKEPEPAVESHESAPEPEKEPVKEAELSKEEKEKKVLHKKASEILAKHGGKESEIPLSSEYWDLMNKYRAK